MVPHILPPMLRNEQYEIGLKGQIFRSNEEGAMGMLPKARAYARTYSRTSKTSNGDIQEEIKIFQIFVNQQQTYVMPQV